MVSRFSSLVLVAILSLVSVKSFAAMSSPKQRQSNAIELKAPAQGLQAQANNAYSYNFGYWPINYSTYQDFNFANTGSQLFIYSIYTFGPSFTSVDNCPYTMYGGQSCTIRIYFRPWVQGYLSGQTSISTSNGTTTIYLTGYGY